MAITSESLTGSKLLFDGQRLEHERKSRGFSTSELATLVGHSRDAYRLWERGLNEPSANAVAGLAHHLGIGIDDLFRCVTAQDLAEGVAVEQVLVVKKVPRHRRQRLARVGQQKKEARAS